jgi:hypothetical protein
VLLLKASTIEHEKIVYANIVTVPPSSSSIPKIGQAGPPARDLLPEDDEAQEEWSRWRRRTFMMLWSGDN